MNTALRPKNFTIFTFVSLFVALAAVACGGNVSDSPGGGTASPPSASPTRTLESMTSAEAQTFCKESLTYYGSKISADEARRAACAILGAFGGVGAKTDAEAQQKCQQSYDACLAKPAEATDAGPGEDPCVKFVSDAKTCSSLTVAEWNACQDEQVALFEKLADPKMCSTVTASGGGTATPTPSCDVVNAKCPALLSDTSLGG